MGPWSDKNTTKGERKMIIKIEIDEARSAKIVEWLAGKFDYMTRSATERGALAANATAAEYNGMREALAMVGIRMTYDRHTKRPIGIEAM